MKKKQNYLQYFLLLIILISFSVDLEAKKKIKYSIAVGTRGSEGSTNSLEVRISTDEQSCLPIEQEFDIEIELNVHICGNSTNAHIELSIEEGTSQVILGDNNYSVQYDIHNRSTDAFIETVYDNLDLAPSQYAKAIITFIIGASTLDNFTTGETATLTFSFNANGSTLVEGVAYADIACCQKLTKAYEYNFNTAKVATNTQVSEYINTSTNFDHHLGTDYVFRADNSITFQPGTYIEPAKLDPVGLGNDKHGSLIASIGTCQIITGKTSQDSLNSPKPTSTNPHKKNIHNLQILPNPFIKNTSLNYTLLKDAMISIVVYDITGRKVLTLVNQEQQITGDYQFTLEEDNLTNGIYNVVINVNNQQENFKIMKIN